MAFAAKRASTCCCSRTDSECVRIGHSHDSSFDRGVLPLNATRDIRRVLNAKVITVGVKGVNGYTIDYNRANLQQLSVDADLVFDFDRLLNAAS